ncbi:MAG: DUF928 domain-containing protein [Cyanobacteria bacterium SBLK]|nr:DUF928 domain-containing protein [Cyanobacteria bacterium SBLK]
MKRITRLTEYLFDLIKLKTIVIILALVLGILFVLSLSAKLHAQTDRNFASRVPETINTLTQFSIALKDRPFQSRKIWNWFSRNREDEKPRPSRRTATTRRGPCPSDSTDKTGNIPLTALIPSNLQSNSPEDSVWDASLEKTLDEHPTFWFYSPETSSSDRVMEFMLLDEKDDPLFEQPIPISLPNRQGIVGFHLTQKSLDFARDYHWFLAIICDPRKRSQNPAVEGWIRRVQLDPDTIAQINREQSIEEKVRLLLSKNIWHDAITIAAQFLYMNRNNFNNSQEYDRIQQNWIGLLQNVGLDEIAEETVVELNL